MAFFIHPNICLLFFHDPEVNFTLERLQQVVVDRGMIVTGDTQPLALRWCNGPTMYASITRGEVAAVLAGRLMGRGRKYRALAAASDAYIEITFESLDEEKKQPSG